MGRVVFGDEPDLARGRARSIDDEARFDVRLVGKRHPHRPPAIIVADHADEQTTRAKRGNVAGDISGAADHDLLAIDGDDRRRRLRRDPRHFAIDEVVKHEIADAQHGLCVELREPVLEIEHQALPIAGGSGSIAFTGNGRRGRGTA